MNIPKMAVLPLTFKNLAEGMEKLKTQVRMSGCTQRCPGSLLQSCPFPALDPNDVLQRDISSPVTKCSEFFLVLSLQSAPKLQRTLHPGQKEFQKPPDSGAVGDLL